MVITHLLGIYLSGFLPHIYYYHSLLGVFLTSARWWFITCVWVTVSFPKSPELFSVFWPISIYAVVWMVSTRPVISKFMYQSFGDCTKSTIYNWYHYHFHVLQFFSVPKQGPGSCLFSISFNFTPWSTGTAKSTIQQVLFFSWPSKVWLSCWDFFFFFFFFFFKPIIIVELQTIIA